MKETILTNKKHGMPVLLLVLLLYIASIAGCIWSAIALDAGAEDFDAGEEAAQVTTTPENFTAVCEALEKKGYTFISADVAQVPTTTTTLTDPDQLVQMGKLLDALEEDDDVQNAWHSLENEEDLDR